MTKKRFILVLVALLAVIGVGAVVLSSDSPSATAGRSDSGESGVLPTSGIGNIESGDIVISLNVPPRLKTLSEKLGVPMEELEKLSPEEVLQLVIDNANVLGVNVYKTVQNEAGEWVPVLIAKGRNGSE